MSRPLSLLSFIISTIMQLVLVLTIFAAVCILIGIVAKIAWLCLRTGWNLL